MKRLISALKRQLVIKAVAFIIFIIIFLPRIAERRALKGSSADIAAYREWKTKRVTIPSDALDVRSYRPETVAAAKAFREAWGKQKDAAGAVAKNYTEPPRAVLTGPAFPPLPEAPTSPNLAKSSALQPVSAASSLSADSSIQTTNPTPSGGIDFDAANRDLAAQDTLIQSFRTLVSQPDYEMGAVIADVIYQENASTPPEPDYLSLKTCSKLLRVQALSQLNDHKYQEASDSAARIVAGARANPYDLLFQQLIAIDLVCIGADTWHDVVSVCNEPGLLRETLKRQNELARDLIYFKACLSSSEMNPSSTPKAEATMHSPPLLSLVDLDMLGMIRQAERCGITVNLKNPTSRELSRIAWGTRTDYLEKIVLPQLASNPGLAEKTRNEVASDRRMTGMLGSIMAPVLDPFIYVVANPNFQDAIILAQVARTKFDLLRLNTARRIYALEHEGKVPDNMEDWAPDLLPNVPRDRFGKNRSAYGVGKNGCYSVGPNGVNQNGSMKYDPTNGTISSGDIFY